MRPSCSWPLLFGKLLFVGICASSFAQSDCETEQSCSKTSSAQKFQDLKSKIEAVRSRCGSVCDTEASGVSGKYYYDAITKEFDCTSLFKHNDLFSGLSKFTFPLSRIPKYLVDDFTYQGRVPIIYKYFDDAGQSEKSIWSKELFDDAIQAFKEDRLIGSYGLSAVKNIFEYITSDSINVKDKTVLVIGTTKPWIEALCLEAGAKKVMTLDYNEIESRHPDVIAVTPDTFATMYLNGSLPIFDAMITFSSVEHSGLGRYGDSLNPWGDLIIMAQAHCVLKDGGRALVGVPAAPTDTLFFNGARIYGPIQFPHLFANWKQIHSEYNPKNYNDECIYCYQPVHIIEKRVVVH